MGRIRTVKPELFLHEELFDLEQETELPLRIAYVGLWTQCDREGRFKWNPRRLKIQILPYDNLDFSHVLNALATRGFLVKYEQSGQEYGWIPSFKEHQFINNKEKVSKLPDPENCNIINDLTRDSHVLNATTSRGVKEGKGMEGNKDMSDSKESRPRTSSYPKEFEQLWQRDWFGEKGSKKEAYQEYKKLKPDTELLQTMTDAIDNQVAYKKQKQKIPPDYFAENMPHVCRWIKKERWTDELPELKYTNGKYEPKRLTFVDKAAYDKFINDPENQKKIKSGEIEVKFQKESYV